METLQKKYEKIDRIAPYCYPIGSVGGGIFKAYFSTYISLLMTNIYRFSVTLAGILESITSVTEWIASALFGVIFDRTRFKSGKYWPWYIIGGGGCAIFYIMIFAMPSMSSDPTKLAVPAAIFIFLAAVAASCANHLGVTIFSLVTNDNATRNRIAGYDKFARDGMKLVLGFITPAALIAFTNFYGGLEVKAWALLAYIYAGVALVIYVGTAFLFKNSFVERNAEKAAARPKKDKVPLSKTIKTIVTNRALLAAFIAFCLVKIYFFVHINSASYTFRYFYGNFAYQGAFMTAFNACAIVGALCPPLWRKIFKETKRCFIATQVAALIGYIAAFFVMKPGTSPALFIICLSFTSFFGGVQEPYVLGLFAGAADYGCWKTGEKDYGTNMALYSISVRVGMIIATWTRVFALNKGQFDAAALDAGAAVPDALYSSLHFIQTILPAIVSVLIILVVGFGYNLTDKQTAQYRAELAARGLKE